MPKVSAFAKAFAGRWRIVEMDAWDNAFLDLVEEATSRSGAPPTARSSSERSTASSTCAMALAMAQRVLSSLGKAMTTMTRPADEDGPASEPPDGLSGTSTSIRAMTQASSANAPDFFSTLLELRASR